ncbi:EF-hand domain-containing family member B-like [Mya arenaria]|uniref:EF-hand domain-containing family member B-like n=1 Tax=Mya arenaria TaxID=6604 RepID=UPI0022E160E4|nr:EF-hand domain-containing family member B-like [Mya arenaria]
MTTAMKLPDISQQTIYSGKYKDWSPDLRPAGKLTATGDKVVTCLKPPSDGRPPSPEVIRKFRATVRPDAGEMRVFYGRAKDPHRVWATEMNHGISTQPSFFAKELVNPRPKSLFQQRMLDRKEGHYASHITAPLGRSHNQATGLPPGLNKYEFTFGIPTELDTGAGGLINPNKTYERVEEESAVGHELYRQTHLNFNVGEQLHRAYTSPNFKNTNKFGIPTPHDNTGKHLKKTLKWLHEAEQERATKIVSKRVDEFRERSQEQLGQVHDPIKDTLRVPPDHTFGILLKPDEYGAGDLLHMRGPGQYLRGNDRQRGVISAIRQHLKKANYHNFQDLSSAFRHYDKDGKGKIDMDDLREACIQFHLPVEPELLCQLMDYCDLDRDGKINYLEFANFLNWKDKMPTGLDQQTSPKTPEVPVEKPIIKDEDLVVRTPQSAETTPRRLQKQIDHAIGDHRTSASMINAVVGPTGFSTKDYRKYGVPTIRTDLPAPRIRRVDDRKNYGDESDAFGLVNPSLFSQRGVYEKDFLLPRSREEIREIFTSCGIQMTGETFLNFYDTAAQRHPKGFVSVESFRSVMDELQATRVRSGQHPLAV